MNPCWYDTHPPLQTAPTAMSVMPNVQKHCDVAGTCPGSTYDPLISTHGFPRDCPRADICRLADHFRYVQDWSGGAPWPIRDSLAPQVASGQSAHGSSSGSPVKIEQSAISRGSGPAGE